MKRRDKWRTVLDAEIQRWSAKSCDELCAELKDGAEYEVQFESVTHQVEIEIVEDTAAYVHVSIAVDDGSLPASIFPASDSNRDFFDLGFTQTDFFCSTTWAGKTYQTSSAKT